MPVQLQDTAPDFQLYNHKSEKISLSQFRGQTVVVLFFPFANTGTCTKEMCRFRDSITDYNTMNAKVLGISVDSPFSLAMWADKLGLTFDLLSDFNKNVSESYGVLTPVFAPGKWDFNGVSQRAAFVIDKEGVVQYAEVLASPGMEPDYQKIKETVSGL